MHRCKLFFIFLSSRSDTHINLDMYWSISFLVADFNLSRDILLPKVSIRILPVLSHCCCRVLDAREKFSIEYSK